MLLFSGQGLARRGVGVGSKPAGCAISDRVRSRHLLTESDIRTFSCIYHFSGQRE